MASAAFAQPTPASSSAPPKWGAHLDVEGKLGNERQLGEGDLFVPLLQNDRTMLFGNIKARMDDSTSTEGNFGVGVRHMLDAGINLGAYGYFDRRKATFGSYFNQVTTGVEALSLDWDLRANLYTPEGRRSHQVESLNTAEIEGTTVVFRGGEERSLRGFDGEVGYRIPVFRAEEDTHWRVFAGAYKFYNDGVNTVQGPRIRTELTFDELPFLWEGSRMTWGGEFQDDIRGKTGFITARLRIPLQVFGEGRKVATLTPLERRMTDPIVRDIDVVTQSGGFGPRETVTQTAAGQTITVISSAITSGADLPTAVTNAGANSTVILSGTFATTAQISMQAGQTLMGAGTLSVQNASGRTAPLTSTSKVTVNRTTGGNGNTIESINDNVTITGLTLGISGANVFAIRSTGENATISNNTLSSSSSSTAVFNGVGIRIVAGSANVTGNTIAASGGENAIALWVGNIATATVFGNTLSASGGATANRHTFLDLATINVGSTGNTLSGSNTGSCGTDNNGSGFVGYTNSANCVAGP